MDPHHPPHENAAGLHLSTPQSLSQLPAQPHGLSPLEELAHQASQLPHLPANIDIDIDMAYTDMPDAVTSHNPSGTEGTTAAGTDSGTDCDHQTSTEDTDVRDDPTSDSDSDTDANEADTFTDAIDNLAGATAQWAHTIPPTLTLMQQLKTRGSTAAAATKAKALHAEWTATCLPLLKTHHLNCVAGAIETNLTLCERGGALCGRVAEAFGVVAAEAQEKRAWAAELVLRWREMVLRREACGNEGLHPLWGRLQRRPPCCAGLVYPRSTAEGDVWAWLFDE